MATEACRLDPESRPYAPFLLEKEFSAYPVNNVDTHERAVTTGISIAYYHHTSGTSSGRPKPISISNDGAVGVLPKLDQDCNSATFTTTPLYHGGPADCFRAWTSGALIWLFPGDVPVTALNVRKAFADGPFRWSPTHPFSEQRDYAEVAYFSCVPRVLEMLASNQETLEILQAVDLVGVGGAALPQQIGDSLVKSGVQLVSRYGSAECGFLMSSHRDYGSDKGWRFLRNKTPSALQFEARDDGLAELVVHPEWPFMAKTTRDDGSFETSDVFQPHETTQDAWRYHSRSDSQLTLVTGKKFDPAPLEDALLASDAGRTLFQDVLIFGTGRPFPGAILFRSSGADDLTREQLLGTIWPDVNALNADGPPHTRLAATMLVFMPSSSSPLERSSKGTILRNKAERRYSAEIDKAYANVDDYPSEEYVDDDDIPSAISKIIQEEAGDKCQNIPQDADLFNAGVDSMACQHIRTRLQSKITSRSEQQLPLEVVYDCRTIGKLSHYLVNFRRGKSSKPEDEISMMEELVSAFSQFLHNTTKQGAERKFKKEVVVLTGATGTLGAHVLNTLRFSGQVEEIHCLVRASSPEAAVERVSKALSVRSFAPIADSAAKIVCLPCKLFERSYLGLSPVTHRILAESATTIIHAAWTVNFSMRLSSLAKDNIAGLRNLLELALSSPNTIPPRFVFCSSTASVLGSDPPRFIAEEVSKDPQNSSSLGYSRSKWVAEAICERAHQTTRLRDQISILRIGQLCGDGQNGMWSVTEAWPLMLSSLRVTGCLPDLDERIDWLRVDIAAQAVVQIAIPDQQRNVNKDRGESDSRAAAPQDHGQHEPDGCQVYHLVNPNCDPSWSKLLYWLKRLEPGFEIVSPSEWVRKLESLTGDRAKHPSRKLLGMWKNAYSAENSRPSESWRTASFSTLREEDMVRPYIFEMDKTKRAAPVMEEIAPIDEAFFKKMWDWIQNEMMTSPGEKTKLREENHLVNRARAQVNEWNRRRVCNSFSLIAKS